MMVSNWRTDVCASALGTIFDDDAGRQVVIDDATVLEGDSGTTSLVFTLTLSKTALTPVTVSYVTSNSSAVAPEDYTTTSGTVTFLATPTPHPTTPAPAPPPPPPPAPTPPPPPPTPPP